MSKRMLALLVAVTTSWAGLAATPSAFATVSNAVAQVGQVTLTTSDTHVTTSTGRKLVVQVTATQSTTLPSGDSVDVRLGTGTSQTSEQHNWAFPVDATALTVDSTGAGTLDVPSADLAPYGGISLTITPVGSPKTQSCNGTPSSQTQDVSVTGTFYFNSASTGSQKWGTVGSNTGAFAFAATNQLTSTYLGAPPINCGNPTKIPCSAGVFWQAQHGDASFAGVTSGGHGVLLGSRTVPLSAPVGATREDDAYATTHKLVLSKSGGSASLPVTADTNSVGAAKLTGAKADKPFSQQCYQSGKKRTETSTSWAAKYKNGKSPLVAHEQVFGAIKVANNSESFFSKSTLT